MDTKKKINNEVRAVVKGNLGLNFKYFDFILEKNSDAAGILENEEKIFLRRKITPFHKQISRMI